jgi:hypothetical protein
MLIIHQQPNTIQKTDNKFIIILGKKFILFKIKSAGPQNNIANKSKLTNKARLPINIWTLLHHHHRPAKNHHLLEPKTHQNHLHHNFLPDRPLLLST